jgi:serine protease Do
MEDILLLDAIERYHRGEMSPKERSFFEELRKNDPEIDQLAVEHIYFLQELDHIADLKEFKNTIDEVENDLVNEGVLARKQLKGKAKVVFLWNKYRRTISVAASIAVIVSLMTAGLISLYSEKKIEDEMPQELRKEIGNFRKELDKVKLDIKKNEALLPVNPKPKFEANFNATGFLIDGAGYIATNAHVIRNAKNLVVENKQGDQFPTKAVYVNQQTDLAILKIVSGDFKKISIPYSIGKGNVKLGAEIYTLGFPREIAVYGEGYLSARKGFSGDTLSYQLTVDVNPGNSGGPVLNRNGEVIGIISSKETKLDGVVYAISSRNIFNALEEIKTKETIKLPSASLLQKLNREQQIEKIEDFVFMVKGN